jgi:oxygen-dependent protoporphyrinogen oxidase
LRLSHGNQEDEGPFRSLHGGMNELTAALASSLPAGAALTRAPVRAIEGRGPFIVDAGPQGRIEAREVILALPAYVAGDLIAPRDADAASMCRAIRYESSATVVLAYRATDVGRPLGGSGFVVARTEGDVQITAATIVSSKWPNRAPEGRMLLRGFFGGSHDPGALGKSDSALVAAGHRDLARVLDIAGEPDFARVYRWPRASPQYDVGHLERIARLREMLQRIPGIHVAGAGFHGTGIADCVADGRLIARRAIARGDPPAFA